MVSDLEQVGRRLWERDTSLWTDDPAVATTIVQRLGWLSAPQDMAPRLGELAEFAQEVVADGYRRVVLLGMGGSSLCPEVLAQAFPPRDGYPTLEVLDSTAPAAVRAVGTDDTFFLVASKSGTTVETLAFHRYFATHAEPRSFAAITDAGTPLQRLAQETGFRRVFVNPSDIGGRFSALSFFGLVPAALLGVDLRRFLDRAAAVASSRGHDIPDEKNSAVKVGLELGRAALAGKNKLAVDVPAPFSHFGHWVEQLVAESTGKNETGIVPLVPGQLRRSAHADGKLNVRLDDPYDLPGAFFHWEFVTAILGAVLGVNPFDEPDVSRSKTRACELLKPAEEAGAIEMPPTLADDDSVSVHGTAPEGAGVVDVLRAHLGQSAAGDYVALLAFLPPTAEVRSALDGIAQRIAEARNVAVTIGFGPRFLHSTGQLHKGGPNQGVFLQITHDDREDLEVPGAGYTFGTLLRAQAGGDLGALQDAGRRVICAHLRGDSLADGLVQLGRRIEDALG